MRQLETLLEVEGKPLISEHHAQPAKQIVILITLKEFFATENSTKLMWEILWKKQKFWENIPRLYAKNLIAVEGHNFDRTVVPLYIQ